MPDWLGIPALFFTVIVVIIVIVIVVVIVQQVLGGRRCGGRLIPRFAGRRIGDAPRGSGDLRAVPFLTLRLQIVSGRRPQRGLSPGKTGPRD